MPPGIEIAFLCALLLAVKDSISKKLAKDIDGTTSAFASFAFALPFYLVALTVLGLLGQEHFTFTRQFLLLVFLRALTDSFAECFKMWSFSYGDLSLVACFQALSPIFLLFTSPLITGDKVQPHDILGLAFVVGATLVVVYRPSSSAVPTNWKAIGLATLSAFFFSLNSCFDRLAVQHGSPVWSAFTMTMLSAVMILPFLKRSAQLPADLMVQARLFSLRGFIEVFFMTAKLAALQYLSAPQVVAIQRSSLVISIFSGRMLFGEQDTVRRLVAGCLIVVGVAVVLLG